MELADEQVSENQGLADAEIPSRGASESPAAGNAPEAAGDKPLSLRDQILKNVETVRTEEAKRARAADGKFTKLEKEAGATDPATPPTNPEPEANAQPAESNPAGPPSAWKGIWETMTPEARAIAVKREAEVEKGFAEYRTKTAQYQEISQALDPVRSVFQQHGLQSDAHAVKRLIEWEGAFRNPQTRMQAFQSLAQTYGVDLSTLVPSFQSGAPSAAQDVPEPLRPVIDQFGNIVQQVQSVESRLQNWEQSQVAEKLAAFAKDKPHFEAVRATMGQLMQAGLVSPGDLDGAYQKAIAIHPEISAQIKAADDKAKADELARANAEKARRAATAAVSPNGRPPTGAVNGSAAGGKVNVRDSILASVKQLREEQRA